MAADFEEMGVRAVVKNINGYTADMGRMAKSTGSATNAISKMAAPALRTSTAIGKLGSAAKGLAVGLGVGVAGLTAAAYAVSRAFSTVVTPLINYNKSIADSAGATGMSLQEMSRLVQVADDYAISQDTLTRSLQMATKNGFAPSIESIARLADETNAMKDPTERAAKLAKILGRSWADLDPLLRAGGSKIRALSAAIEEGLVVTDASFKKTEELRIAVDNLNDSWIALKNTLTLKTSHNLSETFRLLSRPFTPDSAAEFLNEFFQGTALENADHKLRRVREEMEAHGEALMGIIRVAPSAALTLEEVAAAIDAETKALEDQKKAAEDAKAANVAYFEGLAGGASSIFAELGAAARFAALGGEAQKGLEAFVQEAIEGGHLTPEEMKRISAEAEPLTLFYQWAQKTGFEAGGDLTGLKDIFVEAGFTKKEARAFVAQIAVDPTAFVTTMQGEVQTAIAESVLGISIGMTDAFVTPIQRGLVESDLLFEATASSIVALAPSYNAFWTDPLREAKALRDELFGEAGGPLGFAPAVTGGAAPVAVGQGLPPDERGSQLNPGYNLTINTAAPVEQVAADFALMRALGGGR